MVKYKLTNGNETVEFSSHTNAQAYKDMYSIESDIIEFNDDVIPQSLIKSLENTSVDYINFGTELWKVLVQKTWALNTYLKIMGTPLTTTQMQGLLTSGDMLEKCLKTGSLLTARIILQSMGTQLSQYSDIASYGISEITTYLGG